MTSSLSRLALAALCFGGLFAATPALAGEPTVEEGKKIWLEKANKCVACHGEDGKRIRTQNLPNLSTPEGAIRAFQGWPGYRMTGGVMHTLQWRMNDCFRQQRFPEPNYVSPSITALLTYMGVNANGQMYKGPGIKR